MLGVLLVGLEDVVPEGRHHAEVAVFEAVMDAVRGPALAQPAEGDLVDARGVLEVVECSIVEVGGGESAEEEGRGVQPEERVEQQPDQHEHDEAGREEEGGGLVGVEVMGLVGLEEHASGIVEEPAVDGVLDQREDQHAGEKGNQDSRPARVAGYSETGEEYDAAKVDDVGRQIVEAALGYGAHQGAG